jgi:adenylate cyclase
LQIGDWAVTTTIPREDLPTPVNERFTLEDLARRSGVDLGVARDIEAAGLLGGDKTVGFGGAAITKLRLVRSLLEGGFELEDLARAVDARTLSLDFVDTLMPAPVPLVPLPDDSALVNDESLSVIKTMLGSSVDNGAIRQDDLTLLHLVSTARELGAPLEHLARIVRATALSAQRIVELQREFVDEVLLRPAIEETGSPVAALQVTADARYRYREMGMQMVGLLLNRFADDGVFRNIADLTELTLRRGQVEAPKGDQAIVFIDVSNYTRLSREVGDAAAAEQAILLTDIAQESASAVGGRLVKSLGDGALAHFPTSIEALTFALDIVYRAEERGLWPLHAGVNSGPMLRRDGDYYGTTVNVASRIADAASPGQVVVTGSVADAWSDSTVKFDSLGLVPVKNVDDPVEIFVARPV